MKTFFGSYQDAILDLDEEYYAKAKKVQKLYGLRSEFDKLRY